MTGRFKEGLCDGSQEESSGRSVIKRVLKVITLRCSPLKMLCLKKGKERVD